jgi:hypothetical protein
MSMLYLSWFLLGSGGYAWASRLAGSLRGTTISVPGTSRQTGTSGVRAVSELVAKVSGRCCPL